YIQQLSVSERKQKKPVRVPPLYRRRSLGQRFDSHDPMAAPPRKVRFTALTGRKQVVISISAHLSRFGGEYLLNQSPCNC
ncbi:hypothetical protein, partial [Burkholderia cenocepacia]|uniref:hypothetical protein n=1 Tax=Burkholderia cenocepacia TaxID=95486 RepID=UPI001C0C5138